MAPSPSVVVSAHSCHVVPWLGGGDAQYWNNNVFMQFVLCVTENGDDSSSDESAPSPATEGRYKQIQTFAVEVSALKSPVWNNIKSNVVYFLRLHWGKNISSGTSKHILNCSSLLVERLYFRKPKCTGLWWLVVERYKVVMQQLNSVSNKVANKCMLKILFLFMLVSTTVVSTSCSECWGSPLSSLFDCRSSRLWQVCYEAELQRNDACFWTYGYVALPSLQ